MGWCKRDVTSVRNNELRPFCLKPCSFSWVAVPGNFTSDFRAQSLDTDIQRRFYSTWPPSFSSHIKKELLSKRGGKRRWPQTKTGVVHASVSSDCAFGAFQATVFIMDHLPVCDATINKNNTNCILFNNHLVTQEHFKQNIDPMTSCWHVAVSLYEQTPWVHLSTFMGAAKLWLDWILIFKVYKLYFRQISIISC